MQNTSQAAGQSTSKSRIVIFGASGDLTKRKLIPALYRLFSRGMLPQDFSIIGVGRTSFTDAGFREHLLDALQQEMQEGIAGQFCERISYLSADPSKSEELALLVEKARQGGWASRDQRHRWRETPQPVFPKVHADWPSWRPGARFQCPPWQYSSVCLSICIFTDPYGFSPELDRVTRQRLGR